MESVLTALKKPWVVFLLLALAMQQANLLTYRFGAHNTTPYLFMVYAFAAQCVVNILLILFFKDRGFSVYINPAMKRLLLLMIVIYTANETGLIYIFSLGAPYGPMMAIFAVSTLALLVTVSFVFLKEAVSIKKVVGIMLAVCAILLVKLG